MKSLKLYITAFALFFINNFMYAQSSLQFQKALGGSNNEFPNTILQTADEGYIISGQSHSNDGNVHGNHGENDMWVVKLNKTGAIQWSKTYGGNDDESAFSIDQTTDNGYILAGQSNSIMGQPTNNHGATDVWIVKIDSVGNLIWQKSLGGSGNDFATSVQQTYDGGYIVGGGSNSTDQQVKGNHGADDEWIIKLDVDGKIQWKKTYGGTGSEILYSIKQTSDSGYITAGNSNSTNGGDVSGVHDFVYGDMWITRLDKNGNLLWQKAYGGSDYDLARSIDITKDGGYIVGGYTRSNNGNVTNNHGNYDYWVIKLNSSGNLRWQKTLGGSQADLANSIEQTNDNGFIVAGGSGSIDGDVTGNNGKEDFWIAKLSNKGVLQWQKSLGSTEYEEAKSIIQTKDGGYAAAGSTGFSNNNNGDVSGSHGSYDYWFVKLDASGSANVSNTNNIAAIKSLESAFTLSPNPASSFINIEIKFPLDNAFLKLVNNKGETISVQNLKNIKVNYSLKINTADLAAGVYYITIQSLSGSITRQFIKE